MRTHGRHGGTTCGERDRGTEERVREDGGLSTLAVAQEAWLMYPIIV